MEGGEIPGTDAPAKIILQTLEVVETQAMSIKVISPSIPIFRYFQEKDLHAYQQAANLVPHAFFG
jgi:hypothetical protein